ncbi:LuxR C-terminal-related transcriptional regulator [Paenibacillus sp. HJGM_3]|uniref:LuxR C-terminal-related transcriptional regulator n=1 Tax=Paenibacillus sp. HJGM_3 TaxID=3379816 RepID=UPI00385B5C39
MSAPLISTKLYIPQPRVKAVLRPRLVERLNEGVQNRLTLLSASAGYGKTTLVSEWLAAFPHRAAWLSLDEGDNDLARFLTYLTVALQTVSPHVGVGVLGGLQSAQPPSPESIITALLNDVTAIPHPFVLVLDDYHVIEPGPIDDAVSLLLERMPAQMRLVLATREDPRLPLARLRVRNQLTELRAADLRFTASEAAEFLGRVMGLTLSSEHVTLLESRTEGWVAGLQLAALSLQGHQDPASFIGSFTGSHHYVLDYVVEEMLKRQSVGIQTFLLRTSILDRLCGPLCDAVLRGEVLAPSSSGQQTLESLERANLFIVPLDNERHWYRYHHLFAELLRKRLLQQEVVTVVDESHIRASTWYEDHGLELEAFHHAAAARDTDRAARLLEGKGIPLLFRGAVAPVMKWLDSLPEEDMDARPSLRVMHASALLMVGQMAGVEPKLQAAEKALSGMEPDERNRDLIGHIASIRASMAVSRHQAETILAESRRALDYLRPDNLPVRTATTWTLGYAYYLQGDRASAGLAYAEALSIGEKIGHVIITLMATLGLANIEEAENRLYSAADTYRRALSLAGDPPLPAACEAHLGLARVLYEWNELDAALQHGEQAVELAKQLEHTDRVVAGEVFLARLKLAHGEASGAAAILDKAEHYARRHNYSHQLPRIAAAQVLVLLRQGDVTAAARLAYKHEELPLSQARVHLAKGDTAAAVAVLARAREQAEANLLEDERLKLMVVQAVALHAHGEALKAGQVVADALTMAEPGGFIRIFVDEGMPMRSVLEEAAASTAMPEYVGKLIAEWESEEPSSLAQSDPSLSRPAAPLIEPLSARELEVLRLIAEGLSNHEIGERLYIALTTVKGHNRIIFDKLQVKRRTEAVARAREWGLL